MGELVAFLVAVVGVAGIAFRCSVVAFGSGGSPDDKKWALAVLAAIVSFGVGHATRPDGLLWRVAERRKDPTP